MLSNAGRAGRISSFRDLVAKVTGDDADRIAARFDDWIKRRTFGRVLAAQQPFASVDPLDSVAGGPPDAGRHRRRRVAGLPFAVPPQWPNRSVRGGIPGDRPPPGGIAADRRPGVESLHPIDPAQLRSGVRSDRVCGGVTGSRRVGGPTPHPRGPSSATAPAPQQLRAVARVDDLSDPEEVEDERWWRVRIRKGARQRLRLYEAGIVAATSVALEPGGDRIALVGLDEDAVRDLWLIDPGEGSAFEARRLTRDVAAEHDVSWGPRRPGLRQRCLGRWPDPVVPLRSRRAGSAGAAHRRRSRSSRAGGPGRRGGGVQRLRGRRGPAVRH